MFRAIISPILKSTRLCLQLFVKAPSSFHYTTSCKYSLVLLRMDEIIARNILSWLKLLIKLLLLHLVGCLSYKTRPVGRPRLRWMDQVEEDLRRMKITGWRLKIEGRQVWNRIVEQTRPTQGCRVNRRRRRSWLFIYYSIPRVKSLLQEDFNFIIFSKKL